MIKYSDSEALARCCVCVNGIDEQKKKFDDSIQYNNNNS